MRTEQITNIIVYVIILKFILFPSEQFAYKFREEKSSTDQPK